METIAKIGVFFLGGDDLEMTEIRRILMENNVSFVDKALGWGAKASDYEEEYLEAIKSLRLPVLVELADVDPSWDCHLIDHHGEFAGKPASILQVLECLGLEPTRRQRLIAANDVASVYGLKEAGAAAFEIAEIRKLEREIQGITEEQEAEAARAVEAAEDVAWGKIVRMKHSKCAPVTDILQAEGVEEILVISDDGEINFFGDGQLCARLETEFSGWSGGSGLGQKGGHAYWVGYPEAGEVINFINTFFG